MPVKAWVLFNDKGQSTPAARQAALDDLAAHANPRVVQRRQFRRTLPGLFDEHDLPVPQRYVDEVAATGAQVHVVSRWVNAVSVLATREQLQRIDRLPFVRQIQPVRQGRKPEPVIADDPPAGARAALGFYGEAEEQLTQINLLALHAAGYTGMGVIVGILDTGFQRTHNAFNDAGHPLQVVAEYDFVSNDPDTSFNPADAPGQHNHGTWILGTLGAYKANELVGGAYDASFILAKTEDVGGEYPAEEDNYVAGLEFIELNGGDMATASLGYIDWYTQADLDGLTAVTTVAVNVATANGLYCLNAAGNQGHDNNPATSNLIAPADALQVLACGAVDNLGIIRGFSSDGPTADGRVKPEILARGSNTRTVSSSDDTTYTGVGGTSLSTPLAAGAVACLIQAHPTWTVEQMRTYLMLTADYYVANSTYDPEYVLGYGIINAFAAHAQDCNGNSVNDAVEIAGASVPDCNGNQIPDSCDIAAGHASDCNGNFVPDSCDVAGGGADCNGNQILDACELAAGGDCNTNLVLDECESPNPATVGACCDRCNNVCIIAPPETCLAPDWVFAGLCTVCPAGGCGIGDLFAPPAAPAPYDQTKDRYISFIPWPGSFLYKVFYNGTPIGWVGVPDAQGIARVLPLIPTPPLRNWTEPVVHVADCEIVPDSSYGIMTAVDDICQGGTLPVATTVRPAPKFWGDTVGDFSGGAWSPPNGVVNTNDFVAALKYFQGDPASPHFTRVDVHDQVPNEVVNFSDVFLILKAFQGEAYPFSAPGSCP
ncbi:MAG: S8 family serine peptidase [Planctomycetes bacterium]|nr:S8 family serine peptidase [Planctomycetota bacterium]